METSQPDVSDKISHCFTEYAEVSNQEVSHFSVCTEVSNKILVLLKVRGGFRHELALLRVRGFSSFRSTQTNLNSWHNLPSGNGAK